MSERIGRLRLLLLGAPITVLALAATANADTIYVCWDGSGDYLTIQEGIDAASDGDEVIVCDGTYTGPGNRDLDFAGKAITVRSENGPETCIIDCQGSGRGFYFRYDESATSVVDGLTIRNGYTTYGAGVYCYESNPTIADCIISENTATMRGGGIYCYRNSSPTISGCVVRANTAESGGGVSCYSNSSPTISNCTIAGNAAVGPGPSNGGGGIMSFDYSDPQITGCAITGNVAAAGGGLVLLRSDATIANCTIAGNVADYSGGGGIDCTISYPTITNCSIIGNAASSGPYPSGGGIVMWGGPTIADCTIAGNTAAAEGGALYCGDDSTPTLTNSTIAANWASDGRALACDSSYQGPSTVQITNCILWNGGDEIWNNDGSTITIAYSDVQGGWPGAGNMDADPEFSAGPSGTWTADGSYDAGSCQITFADADATWSENELAGKSVNPDIGQMLQFVIVTNTATTMTVWADWATIDAGVSWVTSGASYQMHDHHLTIESPCTDAGDPHFVPGPDERDIDGQMRVWDGDDDGEWIVDMGSDEFGSIIPGDLDGDGCVGHSDLGLLLGDWGCTTGDCPGDCDFDGDTDHADLGILLAHWGEGCP